MFWKNCFRLILKTKKRFFSLFMIVLIGVALMVGLLSTPPIMRKSVDSYNDQSHLMDLQLYSNYGFSAEDYDAIRRLPAVEQAMASRFKDMYMMSKNGEERVVRLEEIERQMNLYNLIEGRMPQQGNEALVIQTSSYYGGFQLGERIEVYSKDEDSDDQLQNKTFTIVGMVDSAQYLARLKETSTLDNMQLSTVFYIPAENFTSEIYTTVYICLKGAEDILAYTSSYERYVEPLKEEVTEMAKIQQELRKEEITEEIAEKIADGETELADKTLEADREFADAQKKLDDAKKTIDTNTKDLQDAEKKVQDGLDRLREAEGEIAANEAKVYPAIQQLESQTGLSLGALIEQTKANVDQYNQLLEKKAQVETVEQQKRELRDNIAQLEAAVNAIDEPTLLARRAQLVSAAEALPDGPEKDALLGQIAEIDAALQRRAEMVDQLAQLNIALNTILQQVPDGTLNNIIVGIQTLESAYGGDPNAFYQQLISLRSAREQLSLANNELAINRQELVGAQKEIEDGRKKLNDGIKEYEDGVSELADAKEEFAEKVSDAQRDIDDAKQELKDLPDAEWMILDRKENYHTVFYQNTIDQMTSISRVIPLLFFLVAALVCLTTMTRLLDESRTELGTLSALGISKTRIVGKYVIYAATASLSGALFGIVVGLLIFPPVIYREWRLLYDLPPLLLSLEPGPILIGVLSFALLMMSVTAIVALKSLKEMPSQLMRPKAPKNMRKVFLEKIPFIWNRLSFTSKITMRNIIRYKSRFFMTVIGVAGCTGLLVMGFGIKDSIRDVIDLQYEHIIVYDHAVNLSDDEQLKELLTYCDNHTAVPYLTYAAKTYSNAQENDETLSVYVMNKEQIDQVIHLYNASNDDKIVLSEGVIINEKYALNHNLSVGDTITVEDQDGHKKETVIQAVCQMYFQHYMFMSEETYSSLFARKVHPNGIALISGEDRALLDQLKAQESVLSITDFTGYIDNFENMIKALDIVILVIILAAGSLAFVVLINLTQVNISERIREIATLKVLGFYQREVRSYLYKEIALLAFLGAVVGLPLGIIEHRFVMTVINMDQIMFGKNIKPISFVYGFSITAVFAVIVLCLTAKSLREIEMVESLKSIE